MTACSALMAFRVQGEMLGISVCQDCQVIEESVVFLEMSDLKVSVVGGASVALKVLQYVYSICYV